MQKTSTSGNFNSKRIYRALRNHRHAVSDPGFDKISPGRYFNIPTVATSHSSYDTMSLNHEHQPVPAVLLDSNKPNISGSSATTDHYEANKTRKGSEVQDTSSGASAASAQPSSRTTDFACQTPDEKWILNDVTPDDPKRLSNGGHHTSQHVPADSPSEGYHSQQSSGSPTPNTERVHFPTPTSTDPPPQPPVQQRLGDATTTQNNNIFRRNRSNEVLTSLNV